MINAVLTVALLGYSHLVAYHIGKGKSFMGAVFFVFAWLKSKEATTPAPEPPAEAPKAKRK